MFVYLITNTVNGKRYAGQTSVKKLDTYWKYCLSKATSGSKSKPALYNSIRKYGPENFIIEPLAIVYTKEDLNFYEIFLIKEFNLRNPDNGYNLTDGGEGTPGRIMSDENKVKLSQRMKGKKYGLGHKMTEENKIKLLDAHIGMKHTEEARKKMSVGHLDKPMHENTKKALANAIKGNSWNVGKRLSEETRCRLSESLKKYWNQRKLSG